MASERHHGPIHRKAFAIRSNANRSAFNRTLGHRSINTIRIRNTIIWTKHFITRCTMHRRQTRREHHTMTTHGIFWLAATMPMHTTTSCWRPLIRRCPVDGYTKFIMRRPYRAADRALAQRKRGSMTKHLTIHSTKSWKSVAPRIANPCAWQKYRETERKQRHHNDGKWMVIEVHTNKVKSNYWFPCRPQEYCTNCDKNEKGKQLELFFVVVRRTRCEWKWVFGFATHSQSHAKS